MRKNKIISLILVIVLCFTTTIFVATANTKEAFIEITIDKSELNAGESAIVFVDVTTNFPVATMSIPVFYNKSLVTVSDATATLTNYSVMNTTTDSESVNSSKVYANTGFSEDDYSFVLVTYIGAAGTDVAEKIDGTVLTFKVTAKADVEGDALVKCVPESAKTSDNVAGMLYFGSPTSGKTINSVPENVEKIDVTEAEKNISIINEKAVPQLQLSEYGVEMGAIIDTDICTTEYTGAVYGIDTLGGETLEDYFETPVGSIEIVENENGVFSTGATVNRLDADGNIVETYVFIYFGDVNGDEFVDSADAGDIEAHDWYLVPFEDDSAALYAGDVNYDGFTDSADAGDIEAHDWYIVLLPEQAEIAAGFAEVY